MGYITFIIRFGCYYCGVFTDWLLEQLDRDDITGKCAQLCWSDQNSGCAGHYRKAGEWAKHFETKHSAKADQIMALFLPTVHEYLNSLEPRMGKK